MKVVRTLDLRRSSVLSARARLTVTQIFVIAQNLAGSIRKNLSAHVTQWDPKTQIIKYPNQLMRKLTAKMVPKKR